MLGENIRDFRIKMNLSQLELSAKLGLSPSAIGMYEKNKREPDIDTLKKMATLFNCSIDELIGYKDCTPSNPIEPVTLTEVAFLEKAGSIIQKTIDGFFENDESAANHFGITKDLIFDIVHGFIYPPLSFLEKLSTDFKVSTDYLLGLTNVKRSPMDNGTYLFRFSPIAKHRFDEQIKEHLDKYYQNTNYTAKQLIQDTLSLTDIESHLLLEYGFAFHFQIINELCDLFSVTADYLLGRTDSSGMKVLQSFNNLNEANQDITIGEIRKLIKEQSEEERRERYEKTIHDDKIKMVK